jgi:hypothetical protein
MPGIAIARHRQTRSRRPTDLAGVALVAELVSAVLAVETKGSIIDDKHLRGPDPNATLEAALAGIVETGRLR